MILRKVMNKVPDNRLGNYKSLLPNKNSIQNRNGIVGYIDVKKKEKESSFFVINKEDGTYVQKFNSDGTVNKKTERHGAVCGHAKGAKEKDELVNLINKLIGYNRYNVKNKNLPNKYKTAISEGKTMCQEIEVLLRHYDRYAPNVTNDYRYFYRRDETYLYKPRS